jgi:hypothetical protein
VLTESPLRPNSPQYFCDAGETRSIRVREETRRRKGVREGVIRRKLDIGHPLGNGMNLSSLASWDNKAW